MELNEAQRRREIRSAEWRGAWRMLGAQLALLIPVAILFPVFAQSKIGPKFGIDSVPEELQAIHRDTGRWPESLAELQTRWGGADNLHHRAAFLKLKESGDEAEYAVAFDSRLAIYRIGAKDRPQRLASAVYGTLGPRGSSR